MSKKKVLLRGVFINRDTNGEGVLKVGTTLIRVSTVMGILYVPEKTDKIVECATMLGYMSPLLCVSTWISGIENTQIYKWGIIILVHILGIGIPLLVKKKK